VRIATWNVNSLKVRMPRIEEWLSEVQPDVLCMQETKIADDAFPALAFAGLGYESVHHGQGRWNGVAILSKVGLEQPVNGWADGGDPDPDARIITATCGGVRISSVYVPNGRSLDDPHYQYKLSWLARLRTHLEAMGAATDQVVVTGDFNIAPDDRDVYDPGKFIGATHVSAAERKALQVIEDWGLVDVFRRQYDADRVYSWWDYRAGDFHMGRGLRIDLVLASEAVANRAQFAIVDRNARKGQQPSDHAPVIVDLADAAV
jgi:exodeoxyribonuclease-3